MYKVKFITGGAKKVKNNNDLWFSKVHITLIELCLKYGEKVFLVSVNYTAKLYIIKFLPLIGGITRFDMH